MKILITIWIIFSLSVHAQFDCGNYKTFTQKVDETYSELSQRPFPNHIKFTLSQKDIVKLKLFNVNGELVYQENFGLIDVGTYIIKFFNSKCSGVYFVSSEIGNKPAFMKGIQITSEELPLKVNEIIDVTSASNIEGVWKRSYSENFIPAIQLESDFHKIEYHYKYVIQLKFAIDEYKILSERTDEDNDSKKVETFEGKFFVKDDTLKLYEDSKLKKIFQYEIKEDTLSISYLAYKDNKTGAMVIPMERFIYNTEIRLIGKYHK